MENAGKLKSSLRQEFLNRRGSLSRNEVTEKSSKIFKQVAELSDFKEAGTVHCYISMNEQNEVLTGQIIEMCFALEKKVVVPKMVKESRLEHYIIEQDEPLIPNSWGVPEPVATADKKADISDIDLILIPMVAADREKNRLGYGKGFYDRFLSKTDATKAGLLFDIQLNEKPLPAENHDVKLDLLITETVVIR